jgi:iron complex outermembrane recepter protein
VETCAVRAGTEKIVLLPQAPAPNLRGCNLQGGPSAGRRPGERLTALRASVGAGGLWLALAGAAVAQTVAAAPPAGLSEIVVTAQRREQSVQDVGIAVSVLSGQELALRGVTTLQTLQYQTPGLEITPQFGTGQPAFRLRGVGFDDYASNNSSPVGVYIDEVAYPFPIQTTGQIFDVARVEVLRGPQGTLYGRNTTGGAINILTNGPTASFHAGLDAEGGSYGYGRAEGYLSGPITDQVAFRLAAVTETGGGFQRDRDTGQEIGDLDRSTVRGQLQWTPGSRLTFRLEGTYGYDYSDGQALYRFTPGGGYDALPADRNSYLTGWGSSPAFAALLGQSPDTKPYRHNETYGIDLHAAYDLGWARLTSITGEHVLSRREYEDFDGSSLAEADEDFQDAVKVFSQELRLASEGAGPVKWQGGVYYDKEDLKDRFLSDFAQSLGGIADTRYAQHGSTVAGFGQTDWRVTDRLSLTGGLRLEYERRSLDGFSTDFAANGAAAATLVAQPSAAFDHTRLSGKAEADYRLTHAALVYASASRGVKSGGYTAYNTTAPGQLAPFKPESLWAYEAGLKSQLLGDTLRVNADGFYYDYRDQQVQDGVYDPVYGAIGKIVNAPKSDIWGIEGEVTWRPLRPLEITQSLQYKRGEYTDFEGLDLGASNAAHQAVYVDHDGQDLGFPKLDLNGSASWTQPVFGDYEIVAEADYSYRGKYQPVFLGPLYNISDYWLADATLTFRPANRRWSLGLYGRNITGTRYDLTRNFFLDGINIAAPGAPATFGGRVSYSY